MRRWAEWEVRYVREHWPDMSDAEIGQQLGRSATAVQQTRYHNGITTDAGNWTPEEDAYICEHWRSKTDAEMGEALGRAPHAVYQRGVALGLHRHASPLIGKRKWTTEEIDYLRENWGRVSADGLCRRLGRSRNAVYVMKNRLGLGAYLAGGDYITLNQLMLTITGRNVHDHHKKSWIKNREMPVHKKRISEKIVRVVYLDEFWAWAKKNRSFINFSKIEPLALGKEPDWVTDQRKKDYAALALQRKDRWTAAEDSRLIALLKRHQYGYAELSEMLHRSAGAIQRRCRDLGIKERPVRADNRGDEWTAEDYQILADGIRSGDSYALIGKTIGKSEKAIRGKVYCAYLTESADKVRAMMGESEWGNGAPIPTVAQGIHLSRTRRQVKRDISMLDALLRYRMNELG